MLKSPILSKDIHKSLWKQRNFMLLWSGQLVSWIGTEVSGIALPLIVLALTGSSAQAGGIAAIRGLVYVFWAIPAGVLIDRWNRKIVMVIANLGSGLAMGSIALALAFHNLSVIQLYITSAIEGSFFVFANLGRFASFPKVVSKEQFPAASAQSGTADHIALLVGPPFGGFLYQTVGGFMAFFVDSLSYFLNAFSIFFINIPLGTETPTERKAIHHEIKEATLWFWHQPLLRFLNLLTAGRTILSAGLYLLIIVLAKEQHASSLFIGVIFTIGAGGGILGSFVSAKIHSHFGMKQLLLGISLLSFFIFSLYAIAINDVLLAGITALFYAVDPLYNVTTSSYSAKIVPDEMRGRVTSLARLVVLGAYSFGFFITGNLLQYLGSRWTIGIFSLMLLLLFIATAKNRNLAVTKRSSFSMSSEAPIVEDTYTRLITLLDEQGATYRLIDHEPEGRTELVSTMRGNTLEQAAKCIILMVKLGKKVTKYVLAVVPGDARVSLSAIKAMMQGTYVSFASTEIAERLAGSVTGTVLPFSFNPDLDLVVDPSLLENKEIYFNAARLDRSMVLTTSDYVAIAKPRTFRIVES